MIKNLKKVISTFAAVAILASSASAFAVDFPDVDETASYANAVSALTNLGVVEGDENGKFNPENTVTRAEFTKMVVEAIGQGGSANASTWTRFVDAQGHWGAGYIEVGVAEGFINGYDENTFGPDDKVTYAQAVKMLVAGIGYELWATQQGGYPSGYLAWGSQLDILDGVSGVNNDTALTRAQCATLIYNTLKAPICKVTGWLKDAQGNWYEDYQIMDGTYYNGTAKKYQTLLTEEHDAYVVKGRVMNIDKIKGEVEFQIEKTENFDEQTWDYYTKDSTGGYIKGLNRDVRIEDTDADEMRFIYSEAIVQKVVGAHEEYKMISITPYGNTEFVELAVKDIAVDGSDVPKIDSTKIEIKKEGSANTSVYRVNDKTKLYINGTAQDGFVFGKTAVDAKNEYLQPDNNKTGALTLINSTDPGSTSSDNVFDIVMVTKYESGQVSRIKATEDDVRLTIDGDADSFEWSLVDEDQKDVKFIKNGEVIEYTDVNEDDVVLVAYDLGTKAYTKAADITASDWVEVLVSDTVVEGTATGMSTIKGYVVVDGEQYEFENSGDLGKIVLSTDYALYLDALGYVYSVEEGDTAKNIGIVLSMVYENSYDERPTVRLMTADGEIVKYEVKSVTEDAMKIDAAVGKDAGNTNNADGEVPALTEKGGYGNPKVEEKDDALAKVIAERTASLMNRAIVYTVTSNGELKFKDPVALNSVTGEYKAATSRLDSYRVSEESTKVFDFEAYLKDPSKNSIAVSALANLEDEGKYTAFVGEKNKTTGEYKLMILTEGTTSLTGKSALAVITSVNGQTQTENGDDVYEIEVLKNGVEETVLYEKNVSSKKLTEGAVIMYSVGSEGYVDAADLKVVIAPNADYKAMMTALNVDTTNFVSEIKSNDGVTFANSATPDAYKMSMKVSEASYNTDVKVFYGPVYQATASTVDVFVSAASGNSDIKTVQTLTLDDSTNKYTFDYSKAIDEGVSVEFGGATQKTSAYRDLYVDNDAQEVVKWSAVATAIAAEDAAPMVAFARMYKNDVTDIVFYIAD